MRFVDIDTGHGRVTTRTIQVLPAPADLPFPHVNQVWLIERYTTDPAGTPRSAVAALGVTNLPAQPGTPECLSTLVRHHWGIELLHCSATLSTTRTTPPRTPDQGPASWPPCETSPSERSG